MKRRLFALFLILCMMLTLLPGAAFAEDSEESPKLPEQTKQNEYLLEPDTELAEPSQDSGAEHAEISTGATSDTYFAYKVTGGNIYF